MDLAEIRKKARLQNAPEEATLPDSRLPQTASAEVEIVPEESLDNFWDSDAGLAVTTEEEYAQGLLDHEIECDSNMVQWLTFCLGAEDYALELSSVLELIRPRHLTELPQVPNYLLGIVSLRGVIVPVIDLGRRLHLENESDLSQQRVIVCASGEQQIGLLVDRVTQVVRINRTTVEAPPLVLNGIDNDFISGVGRIKGRMMMLLNPDKVMDIEPLASLDS